MFFVVSTGRSGTMTIARILSRMPGIICLHEPHPELILESSAYRYGKIDGEKVRDILVKTRKPSLDGAIYCESNQTLSLVIPVLVSAFPEARYIWLMRNGLDMVASAYQKQWYTGHSENHDRYEDCSLIEKLWIDGRIEGDRCGDLSSDEWAGLDRFGRCCWYWSYVNRVIESDINRYLGGSCFLMRLEDLRSCLRELVDWMGLESTALPRIEKHNPAKRSPYHWTKWSSKEREIFKHFCGDVMDKYYPNWRTTEGKWKGVEYKDTDGKNKNFHFFAKLTSWQKFFSKNEA